METGTKRSPLQELRVVEVHAPGSHCLSARDAAANRGADDASRFPLSR